MMVLTQASTMARHAIELTAKLVASLACSRSSRALPRAPSAPLTNQRLGVKRCTRPMDESGKPLAKKKRAEEQKTSQKGDAIPKLESADTDPTRRLRP